MEQSGIVDDLRSVPPPTQHFAPSSPRPQTPRLTSSEPDCQTIASNIDDLSKSIPSLRFPRPLGNRQLTNWVSTSSPDIMQPVNLPDDEPTLADLGYDVIGTDGESQAESTTSSVDYQRPDDVQSLTGDDTGTDIETNDADTDSSDDDETFVEGAASTDRMRDAEAEILANQRLDDPSLSDLNQASLSYLESLRRPTASLTEPTHLDNHVGLDPKPEVVSMSSAARSDESSRTHGWPYIHYYQTFVLKYTRKNWRIVAGLSSVTFLYALMLTATSMIMTSSLPKELSTVPVASVSSMVSPQPHLASAMLDAMSTSTLTNTQTPNALQTVNPSAGLSFIPFGKEKPHTDIIVSSPNTTMCSADLSGRTEITVRIPHNIKASWLAKDAILIAVSRGQRDISTNVTSIDEGFLIEVPVKEAHGIVTVTFATTRKPLISESFRINFGTHSLTEALDVGKQLVRDFAQILADTMNETTSWVEETCNMPAFDTMSKQVCEQTASVSGMLLQSLRDNGNMVLEGPGRLFAHMQQILGQNSMLRRADQVQSEIVRHTMDMRDDLGMAILRGQLRSKLLWLKLQGKTQEYDVYLQKAEPYWADRLERAKLARLARAKEREARPEKSEELAKRGVTGLFWSMMGEA